MIEITIQEPKLKPAYLLTLHELIDELNLKQITTLTEIYDRKLSKYIKIRTIQIFGSSCMLNYFLLRLQRYDFYIEKLKDKDI